MSMDSWWLKQTEKYFNAITNLIFVMALGLLFGQIFESGIIEKGYFHNFTSFFKVYNGIFSFLCVSWTLVLMNHSQNLYIKIGRYLFLTTTIIYFIVSTIWIFWPGALSMDFETVRSLLATFVGFIAISYNISALGSSKLHPANLFVASFLCLIFFGTFCLLLPAATNKEITFIQALFTSTSAVTVTGLTVLDTGKDFTLFGQVIIMILIQLGGLGVLTVTNILALLFSSSTSYRNRMMVSDMIKELNSNHTFSSLFKIVSLTLLIEFIGAILVYISISDKNVVSNPMFFSVFHAISAFCNAGFSPLSNSLFESSVRFNYGFQLTICWLIITGGLGYMVMISHYRMIKNWVLHKWSKANLTNFKYEKALLKTSANARIVMNTTFILLVVGTGLFFMAEYHGALKDHDLYGKIVVSFFNSTTPRTAGFNNINMSELGIPSIMLLMALMWIGASPGSTGGGIKTTTFSLGVMNLYNQILGREKMVYHYKEIPTSAINQVNAVIFLSLIAISTGTFFLAFLEPTKLFKDLLFEVISAYSTVGLSLNLTSTLSENSLIVLSCVMFLGRVSFLTFLIGIFGIFHKEKPKGIPPYYPKDNVFIN